MYIYIHIYINSCVRVCYNRTVPVSFKAVQVRKRILEH